MSKDLCLNLPVNAVSFGQVSTLILKEFYKKNTAFNLYPIGNSVDLSTQDVDQNFFEWIKNKADGYLHKIKKDHTCFKLWHLNGSFDSCCCDQHLFSFYELDSPTKEEINIARNQKSLILSSTYACDIFKNAGCNNVKFIPLGFDKYNFKRIEKPYFSEERVVFNLVGKLEKRKHHKKIIQSWAKKYGNNPRYSLQCSIYNHFIKDEDQKNLLIYILEGENYYNINFLNFMPKNSMYNDYLNSADIIIGMSGGEGWGIPEFTSAALGKYAIILNAHSYKDWADEENSILVNPSGKIEAYDNLFFHRGSPYNQGNIFDFNADDFISACELAIEKVRLNRVNESGLKLQEKFSSEKFADNILNIINA